MPVPTQNPGNLVWIDLEMTGLDPHVDVILQTALVVASADLDPLDELAFDVWQPNASARAHGTDRPRNAHPKIGLFEASLAGGRHREVVERVPEVLMSSTAKAFAIHLLEYNLAKLLRMRP